MREKRQISISGSHGKTTTTAMIATVLHQAGLHLPMQLGAGKYESWVYRVIMITENILLQKPTNM